MLHKKTILDNGLRIVAEKMPAVRSVTICVLVGTGSRYEVDAMAGASHFIEHLLFRGTPRRPEARDISEAIEGLGGILNGGTDKEATVYWCKVAQIHEEINISYDSPSQRVSQLIDGLLWPGHPLGRDIAGDKQSVNAITRDDLIDYMKLQYLPANTVISVAGNIEHKKVISTVNQCLGGWSGGKSTAGFKAYRKQPNPRLHIEKRDIEQVHMCLALPGLSIFHPRRFILDLLNVILGEGMSSRLFCEIRDRLGLAYSISSFVEHLSDTGAIVVYAGVEPKNLKLAIRVVLEQLSLLKEETVSEQELTKAREMAKGRLLLRMEDSRSVAGWLGGQEVLTGRILDIDQIVAIIDAITADEIKEMAKELLTGNQLRLALVGPVAEDEDLVDLLKL